MVLQRGGWQNHVANPRLRPSLTDHNSFKTMASTTSLPNGNRIPNGHARLAVSSQGASIERIQIINEEKVFTLVCSGCLVASH